MNFLSKIQVNPTGRPGSEIIKPEMPARLYLPLKSQRLHFATLVVAHGQEVTRGTVLAVDKQNWSIPLLASSGGTIDLESAPGHVVIVTNPHASPDAGRLMSLPASSESGALASDPRVLDLIRLGAWHFVFDARSNGLADPRKGPSAAIVSTLRLDPFVARGDVRLKDRLPAFKRGLEHIQKMVEYGPLYLAIPRLQTALAREIKESVRGYAWLKIVEVPLRYPHDNPRLLAQRLGLYSSAFEGPVWGLTPEGVMAIDHALTDHQPVCERLVSVGGPGARVRCHLDLPTGYPLAQIKADFLEKSPKRLVNGGMFTGRLIEDSMQGVDVDCEGITALPIPVEPEFLRFVKPGFSRRSYSRTFLSAIRPPFADRVESSINGEHRACVNCGFCAEVCPVRMRPFVIHKLVYAGTLDEVERHRPNDCVDCGFCTYVCPSKIHLQADIAVARQSIAEAQAETNEVVQ